MHGHLSVRAWCRSVLGTYQSPLGGNYQISEATDVGQSACDTLEELLEKSDHDYGSRPESSSRGPTIHSFDESAFSKRLNLLFSRHSLPANPSVA